jgi:hypothetical protein
VLVGLNLDRIGKIANQYMTDSVQILRRIGRDLDETTAIYTEFVDTLYTGPAFISAQSSYRGSISGEPASTGAMEVNVPLGSVMFLPEDVVVVLSSRDETLVGREIKVTGQASTTFAATRRIFGRLEDLRDGD